VVFRVVDSTTTVYLPQIYRALLLVTRHNNLIRVSPGHYISGQVYKTSTKSSRRGFLRSQLGWNGVRIFCCPILKVVSPDSKPTHPLPYSSNDCCQWCRSAHKYNCFSSWVGNTDGLGVTLLRYGTRTHFLLRHPGGHTLMLVHQGGLQSTANAISSEPKHEKDYGNGHRRSTFGYIH
jgi:hypothetical protein